MLEGNLAMTQGKSADEGGAILVSVCPLCTFLVIK